MRKDIIDAFAPVSDPHEMAKRIVAWSVNFLGDEKIGKGSYWIRKDIPDIHREIYGSLVLDPRFMYVTAPRGFAKTTIVALVYVLYRIYYELDESIIIIGKNDKAGIRNLRNLRNQIERNEKLIDVYGRLKPEGSNKTIWAAHELKLANGIFIRSIGMMGDVRGSLDDAYRPTLIIMEDVQTVKTMREPATLESHEEYLENEVMYAIDEEFGKVRFIGNIIRKNSLINKTVMKDERWTGVSFSALVNDRGQPDIKGKSVWEDMFPTKKLHEERDYMAKRGKIHVFMAERMNIISDRMDVNLKGYKFHDMSFQRRHEQNVLISDKYPDPVRVNTYCAVDPAYGTDEAIHDERAIVCFAKGQVLEKTEFGRPYYMNMTWILEYIKNHMSPYDIINQVLEFHKKYYFNGVIVEAISGAQLYEPMLIRASMQDTFFSQHSFTPTFVKGQPKNKKKRILDGLQPKCKMGQFHVREGMIELIDELENFEMTSSPHLLDAIETGNRFSFECEEQYSTANEIARRHYREEEREDSDWVPKTLEDLFGG